MDARVVIKTRTNNQMAGNLHVNIAHTYAVVTKSTHMTIYTVIKEELTNHACGIQT